jgi:hypothetical protein
MDIVNTVILLLTFAMSVLLVVAPPFAVWRAGARHTAGRAAWIHLALALVGPAITAWVLVVLMWLPTYSGQCGGWLGETSPCRFGQYATETMYWAALGIAIPGLLGMLLGVAVLLVGVVRRGRSRPAA